MDFANEMNIRVNDGFLENHRQAIQALKQCQSSKGLQSCLNCQSIFTCNTRNQYIKATYESMSKGQEGAFNFN